MMARKLHLGPLPEQRDDYSQYEQTVIRWDRIGVMAGVTLLVVGGLGSWVWQGQQSEMPLANTLPQTSVEVAEVPVIEQDNLVQTTDTVPAAPTTLVSEATASKDLTAQEINTLPATAAGDASLAELPEESAVAKAPVRRLREGISRALLTLDLKDREPGEALGAQVAMNDEGIIKVILFTEMEGLRGKVLHHEWFRNEQSMARVRIPVNTETQRSHSSKFINRQMLGDWMVKVVDDKGDVYATAAFEVVDG